MASGQRDRILLELAAGTGDPAVTAGLAGLVTASLGARRPAAAAGAGLAVTGALSRRPPARARIVAR